MCIHSWMQTAGETAREAAVIIGLKLFVVAVIWLLIRFA